MITPREIARFLTRAVLVAGAVAAFLPTSTGAQGNCNANNTPGNCVIADNANQAISVTITRAVRLALSTTGVPINQPIPSEYDAGFGVTSGATITVKANTGWNLAIRTTQATWTASPPPARANKPAAELQWGLAVGGPYTALTTTNVTMSSGSATAGTVLNMQWRVTYSWLLDTPGSYSLPLQLTLTAP